MDGWTLQTGELQIAGSDRGTLQTYLRLAYATRSALKGSRWAQLQYADNVYEASGNRAVVMSAFSKAIASRSDASWAVSLSRHVASAPAVLPLLRPTGGSLKKSAFFHQVV